jgi:hypothetical protein
MKGRTPGVGKGKNVASSGEKGYDSFVGINKGERHYNEYMNMMRMNDKQLNRSIKSYENKMNLHKNKINNPEQYVNGWQHKDERYKQGLVKRWEREIPVFEEKLILARSIADERGV